MCFGCVHVLIYHVCVNILENMYILYIVYILPRIESQKAQQRERLILSIINGAWLMTKTMFTFAVRITLKLILVSRLLRSYFGRISRKFFRNFLNDILCPKLNFQNSEVTHFHIYLIIETE